MTKQQAVAPAKEKAEKKPAVDSAIIAAMKTELRPKLNELEPKKLDAVAKRFGVDVKKYAAFQPALRKMNTVNSCIGSASRWMREDGKSKKDVFTLLA